MYVNFVSTVRRPRSGGRAEAPGSVPGASWERPGGLHTAAPMHHVGADSGGD